MQLDAIDRRILDLLQSDNTIANVALAERVGLSPPACSRRVARLRREGVILRDISVLDPRLAGNAVTVIVSVTLAERQREAFDGFIALIRARPEVRHCAMVAGSIDFVLHVSLKSVEDYAAFSQEVFIGNPHIGNYESWIVLDEIKNETKLALTD
jgi:Lrp/AsnC family leucine-responsive transcriptional regulator